MSKDMAYQQVLTKFGRLPKLRLEPKLSCRDLLMLQMSREEEEGNWTDEDGCKREAVDLVVDLLVSKSEMLEDYFSLEIDEEGSVARRWHARTRIVNDDATTYDAFDAGNLVRIRVRVRVRVRVIPYP